MFSARAEHVSGTRIFARTEGASQALVYSMHLRAPSELAMVLPIPVVPGSPDDAVEFVDLSGAPRLFDFLAALFAPPLSRSRSAPLAFAPQPAPLPVHSVGAFDASFVPRIPDFARLDPRFRLPDDVWSSLPRYGDWGFAVFKLKSGDHEFHPMAFRFPTRDPGRVFFPTVHVHDGAVHPDAHFDHELYWQGPQGLESDPRSNMPATERMETDSRGIILGATPMRRRVMRGRFANDDVWI